ncbi:kinase domain protein (macronuclear) [Tetrahymena thermophila SB210]|uniref:Kinase domain protein n=1 Tax=Tetrahymena thermophila (strain SB210) TaxID=312017 RepID=Q229D0_TETTS|nr:kinase domain protein [Tetrahymena thermophila SB210]EAR81898.3 kinase domain protein [Tetrahymena thermophila SB210]|eukprot:XP_001029561.3 kinase domain protein [Tetrahymena thermophila SB210]
MGNSLNKCTDSDEQISKKVDTKKSVAQSVKGSIIKPNVSFISRKEPVLDDIQTQMYESGLKKVTCDSDRLQEKIKQCILHLITLNHRVIDPIDSENNVYKIEDIDTGLFFAIKFIDQTEKQYKEQYEKLEAFLQVQDTYSLVRIIEYSNIKKYDISYMIMELCEDNLESLIKQNIKYSLQEAVNITMKLIGMLIDIHSSNLVHLSIEPRKILIDAENNFKLIGFPCQRIKSSKKEKKMDFIDGDKYSTFKAPQQLHNYEKVQQVSFISNVSGDEFKIQSQNLSINSQKDGQEDFKEEIDIFSMGLVILSVIGVNINYRTADEIRTGNFNNIIDMNELNPLVSFVIHTMLQTEPQHRYSALKLQAEILIYFQKLNIGDNQDEIDRIGKFIQNEDQLMDSQLNLSKYQSFDFGEISRSAIRSKSRAKLNVSPKKAYLQFNYYLQYIKSDQSEIAKKAIILAKNIADFKREDLLLFEYYLVYRKCFMEGWVYSLTTRNILEQNYKLRQQIFQNLIQQQSILAPSYQKYVVDSLNSLATSLIYSYESQSSIQYLLAALNLRKVIYQDKNHFEIAYTLSDLGEAYCQGKDYEQALQYHIQSLEMRKQLYNNKPNQFIADSLFNLSKIYYLTNDMDQSIKLNTEGLQMSASIMVQTANIEPINMLQFLNEQQRVEMSELLIKCFAYPRINPHKAEIILKIIKEFEEINKFDICIFFNSQMIDIYTSLFGENNFKSCQRIQKQGEYFKKKLNYKESLVYTQRALKIAIQLDLLAKKELQSEYEFLSKNLKKR